MKPFVAGLALGMLAGACGGAPSAKEGGRPEKPNVLFLVVDDLRPDFAAFRGTRVQTPNLDRLASEGLLFERAYAQLPLCMPSRSSVLSGYRPETLRQTLRVTEPDGGVKPGLPRDIVTLPQLFRANGYRTVSIGKVYHMNDDDPKGWSRRYTGSFAEGYDGYSSDYRLPRNQDDLGNYLRGGHLQGLPASDITEIVEKADDTTVDGVIARHAVEELRGFGESGEPFFLAVGFYRPHMPLTAPKRYWDMYDREATELPASFDRSPAGPRIDWEEVRRYGDCPTEGPLPKAKAREIIQGYRASVTFVDAQIGKVLDALRSLGLDRNTIVVLWSDNGWRLGERGQWSKPATTEIPTRIAMMLKVPGRPAPKPTRALVELVDIYPTLAELCRLPAPKYLEGDSAVPLLADPDRPWKSAAFSGNYGRNETAIRTDRYRLIRHADGAVELYDHRTDPGEDHDLADDPAHAETRKALLARLEAGWKAARPRKPRR